MDQQGPKFTDWNRAALSAADAAATMLAGRSDAPSLGAKIFSRLQRYATENGEAPERDLHGLALTIGRNLLIDESRSPEGHTRQLGELAADIAAEPSTPLGEREAIGEVASVVQSGMKEGAQPASTELSALQQQLAAAMKSLLVKLSAEDRLILRRRLLEDQTWQEIADSLGQPLPSVHRRGCSLIRELRAVIARAAADDPRLGQWLTDRGF